MNNAVFIIALTALTSTGPKADGFYQSGREALKNKDAETAITQLNHCLALDEQHVGCQWELGWAHYLNGDWEKVVKAWSTVKSLDPKHAEVNNHLPGAIANLQAEKKFAQMADRAPASMPKTANQASRIRLRAVGDVMLGTSFPEGYLPPNDGKNLLDDVADWLRDADLTFVNLEGPLCDSGETRKCSKSGNCYAFRSPTRYGSYLKQVGVDLASTANNHAEDFGVPCRMETEATLDKLGIAYSGRPGTVATQTHNGLRVAMIGFHTSRTGHYLNDHKKAVQLVQKLVAQHDIVIVSFHGGAEGSRALHVPQGEETFLNENRGDLRTFSHLMIDTGADLVLGHGPHVLRGMEVYKDRLIAYSLGNFATYGRFSLSGYLGVGAVLEVELDNQGRFLGGKILPTRQKGKGIPVKDNSGRAIQLVRRLSKADFGKSAVQVAKNGDIRAQ